VVQFDHSTDVFVFTSQNQFTVIGPGSLPASAPVVVGTNRYKLTLLPDPSQEPAPITILAYQNAFGLSLPSSNNVTLPYGAWPNG
jgi:hypothetical protein